MSDQQYPQSNQQPPMPQQMTYVQDDEIDLSELFAILWAEKWLITCITAAAAIISVVVSLLMTEIYRADATLAPSEVEQNAGGLSPQLGGAAALLGVSLGGGNGNNVSNAIATLRSRQFIGRFIADNDLLVPLFASSWDKNEQRSVIDEEIYNADSGHWLLEYGPPNDQEAYRVFSNILSISGPARDSGIVTVAITWHNPMEAAMWLNKLIAALNQEVRARDVNEANSAIAYLRQQLEATQLVDMQRVFFQLIESQTRITMLADVRDEYVFRVIDPAVTPDRKLAPKRALIAIIGTLAGGILGVILVFVRRMLKKVKAPA
jgi:uncharacterized protein involved in exopolysaccharide biosynthesis